MGDSNPPTFPLLLSRDMPLAGQFNFKAQPFNYLQHEFPELKDAGLDLLTRMLTWDPKQRRVDYHGRKEGTAARSWVKSITGRKTPATPNHGVTPPQFTPCVELMLPITRPSPLRTSPSDRGGRSRRTLD